MGIVYYIGLWYFLHQPLECLSHLKNHSVKYVWRNPRYEIFYEGYLQYQTLAKVA